MAEEGTPIPNRLPQEEDEQADRREPQLEPLRDLQGLRSALASMTREEVQALIGEANTNLDTRSTTSEEYEDASNGPDLNSDDERDPTGSGDGIAFDDSGPRRSSDPRRQTWNYGLARATVQAGARAHATRPTLLDRMAQERAAADLNAGTGITIDGIRLTVLATSNSDSLQTRLWDRTKRADLPPDVKQEFVKHATGYVLAKHNKLQVPTIDLKAHAETLSQLCDLQNQIKTLKRHVVNYDIGDVFHIVTPQDVWNGQHLVHQTTYDLFADYVKIHPDMVANSNAWYNKWIGEPYVRENMAYSYSFLQNNTTEKLWLKCTKQYETYASVQQGGPLMLCLLLRRIRTMSETALDRLKDSVSKIRISSIPGEDVEQVISLIKSTLTVLKSASTPERSYVPEDFVKTVITVFQTSSVPQFNSVFEYEYPSSHARSG